LFENSNQTKLTTSKKIEGLIIVEQDVIVEGKNPIKDEHNADEEEKKSITEEDGATRKPVPLSRSTK